MWPVAPKTSQVFWVGGLSGPGGRVELGRCKRGLEARRAVGDWMGLVMVVIEKRMGERTGGSVSHHLRGITRCEYLVQFESSLFVSMFQSNCGESSTPLGGRFMKPQSICSHIDIRENKVRNEEMNWKLIDMLR